MPLGNRLLGMQTRRAYRFITVISHIPCASMADSPDRCDLGVNTAAFAALGLIAALLAPGVKLPFVAACSGVKAGESPVNRLFCMFSFACVESFATSCM
jgi:hypothetical protein